MLVGSAEHSCTVVPYIGCDVVQQQQPAAALQESQGHKNMSLPCWGPSPHVWRSNCLPVCTNCRIQNNNNKTHAPTYTPPYLECCQLSWQRIQSQQELQSVEAAYLDGTHACKHSHINIPLSRQVGRYGMTSCLGAARVRLARRCMCLT